MSAHFSSREFIDALDGTLPAARRTHLAECDRCGNEHAALQALRGEAGEAGVVPEPSPLFWRHFSDRIREATASEPIPQAHWWEIGWRPFVTIGAMAAIVLAIVLGVSHRTPRPEPVTTSAASTPAPTLAVDDPTRVQDATLEFMADMASDLSPDELQQATHPTSDATASVIGNMTPAQYQEFLRLIKAEIGDSE